MTTKFSTRLEKGNYFAFSRLKKELVLQEKGWIFEFFFAGHPAFPVEQLNKVEQF